MVRFLLDKTTSLHDSYVYRLVTKRSNNQQSKKNMQIKHMVSSKIDSTYSIQVFT